MEHFIKVVLQLFMICFAYIKLFCLDMAYANLPETLSSAVCVDQNTGLSVKFYIVLVLKHFFLFDCQILLYTNS